MPSSTSPIPGLPSPNLPKPDLGFPLRYSRGANATVGEAIKGTYVMGAADGFSVGHQVGYTEGHVAGAIEGAFFATVVTSSCFAFLLFLVLVAIRMVKGKR